MAKVNEFRQVGKASDLIRGLEALWGQDKIIEARLRKAKIVFIVCCVAVVLSLFIGLPAGAPWVLLLTIPAAIVSGVVFWRLHGQNMDDRRILTPIKFLQVLQADIPPGQPVKLVVNFDGYEKHGKKLAREPSAVQFEQKSGNRRAKYEDLWMEAEGWLAEKTRFRVAVSQSVAVAEKRKRKYTKRKERIREAVAIHLRPNAKLYQGLDRFPAQFAAREAVAGLRVESARATRRGVLLVAEGETYTKLSGRSSSTETGAEHLVQGDKLLILMAAVFERLRRCQAPAVSPKGA